MIMASEKEPNDLLIDQLSIDNFSLALIFKNLNIEATFVTFCNPFSFKILKDNKRYLQTITQFNYIFSDGILLVKLCSIKGKKIKRYSFDGNSIAIDIFNYCVENKLRVALIGGTHEENSSARTKLLELYNFEQLICHSGYYKEESNIINDILFNEIDVVIVGMGAPLQDDFLIQLSNTTFKGVGFTCGGYITQISMSGLQYYPEIINKLNLRSFYRVYKEPNRLLKRYTIDYFPFYRYFIKSILKKLFKSEKK